MAFPSELSTERLNLKRLACADACDIFDAFAQDIEVARYLTWTPRQTVEQVEEFIADRRRMWAKDESFAWSVRDRDGNLVGIVEGRVDHHRVELGYVLARPYWGQGLATEVVGCLVDAARSEPSVSCVWAYVDVDNTASSRVLEKAGLARKGLMERWAVHPNISDEPRDCWIHSLRIKSPD